MNKNSEIAQTLASRHPVFTIHSPLVDFTNDSLVITHRFSASGGLAFNPVTRVYGNAKDKESALRRLAIYGSMVESLSYWKACFSPKIVIEPRIPRAAIQWYEDLLQNGMMEYRFSNNLPARFIPEIQWQEDDEAVKVAAIDDAVPLVLVSGGKDSTLTLSLLRQDGPLTAFVLNRLPAAERVLAAFPDIELIRSERTIDPALLELNRQGYLNGHTPFSALLSVVSTIAAILAGASMVIASNESSAEVPFATYEGLDVNHQYSKSFQYENSFSHLLNATLPGAPRWFSILRSLSEPQICLLLSKKRELLSLITSCNRNQSVGSWCGECPKCVSTWILLHPYVSATDLTMLFGKNALQQGGVLLDALLGKTECRPLECVGTPDELDASLRAVAGDKLALERILAKFPAAPHAIPAKYEQMLKLSLAGAQYA